MAMQINLVASPEGIESLSGYTPMDVAIEILIGANGQIGPAELLPQIIGSETRKRFWLPDIPRTSGIAPIVGADKLDYYHPTRKPDAAAAMAEILKQRSSEVPELQWILDWMNSDSPLELELSIAKRPKADIAVLENGRIVWRLVNGQYIHDLPKIQSSHEAQTLERAMGGGGGSYLLGALPRIHTKKLSTPLLGCNDDLFRSWGQTKQMALNILAKEAVTATQRYTELLEAKGHNIWLGNGRYWVWGALPEMALAAAETKAIAAFFGSEGDELDPVGYLETLIESVKKGATSLGKPPDNLKIACGYIGIGGSGKGRAAIGQMTERSAIEFLTKLQLYHQKQRRFLTISKPYWVFGALTIADGGSKSAISKANEQIFEAMINGCLPPRAITNSIIHRLKIEGVPNSRQKKTNREWAQVAYLAWLSPDFIEGNEMMKPDTTLDNLFAWHVGRVFAACKAMSYHYAARVSAPDTNWKDPLDAYRQTLFSSPAQGFTQIMAKVSPYLAARPDKAGWFHKTVAELSEDCPSASPPKRWNDEQAFFLALGISQFEAAKRTTKIDQIPNHSEDTNQNT
jgi:CRISPR-associated protein (Cas_Csd1)